MQLCLLWSASVNMIMCKSVFYLLVRVNGHMGVQNLTDKSAFITYHLSVLSFVLFQPIEFSIGGQVNAKR